MENNNGEVAPEVTEVAEPETAIVEETVEEVKARLEEERQAREKAEELANNYKIRAEKAEKGNKVKVETPVERTETKGLSTKDIVALTTVHEDDIDEVVDYARFKGITVVEAKKTDHVKAILALKAEQRNTAIATNTGSGRRSTTKVSDEALLAQANSGKVPESDEDIERLIKAKQRQK